MLTNDAKQEQKTTTFLSILHLLLLSPLSPLLLLLDLDLARAEDVDHLLGGKGGDERALAELTRADDHGVREVGARAHRAHALANLAHAAGALHGHLQTEIEKLEFPNSHLVLSELKLFDKLTNLRFV